MVDLNELIVPSSINNLLALRKKARAKKDWKASDKIRSLIKEEGMMLKIVSMDKESRRLKYEININC